MFLTKRIKKRIRNTAFGRWYIDYVQVPFGLRFLNFLVHRILRVTSSARWGIHFTSRVAVRGNLHLGKDVDLSLAVSGGCYIQAYNGIYIGDGTRFAPGVKIISANHTLEGDMEKLQPGPPIRIGRRCWLGANAVILPGVELGDCVIVGAGAVVTKSFPSGSIVAGVPASVIGTRRIVLPEQDDQSAPADGG